MDILLFVLNLFSLSAQTTRGISVQGIARDSEKAALVDETLTFTFIVQGDDGGTLTKYYKEDIQIKTDPFGVFSHIIGTGNKLAGSRNFEEIPFRQIAMDLVISVNYNSSEIELSNSPLQYAPYAISAENGVPTGTIVAFAGEEEDVPSGWMLCDGSSLVGVSGSLNLQNLIGDNVPDLQGMFLRGTGTSPVNGQDGPALRMTQDDGFESHSHSGMTTVDGEHQHSRTMNDQSSADGDGAVGWDNEDGQNENNATRFVDPAGEHSHSLVIDNTGIAETRPVNYGVNYIIKL